MLAIKREKSKMNFLRKLVSGKRNRFQYQKYDLDITYVTKRVCGMSFPASGFEQVYRNNINDVSIVVILTQSLMAVHVIRSLNITFLQQISSSILL